MTARAIDCTLPGHKIVRFRATASFQRWCNQLHAPRGHKIEPQLRFSAGASNCMLPEGTKLSHSFVSALVQAAAQYWWRGVRVLTRQPEVARRSVVRNSAGGRYVNTAGFEVRK
jgi:hypothetical protein